MIRLKSSTMIQNRVSVHSRRICTGTYTNISIVGRIQKHFYRYPFSSSSSSSKSSLSSASSVPASATRIIRPTKGTGPAGFHLRYGNFTSAFRYRRFYTRSSLFATCTVSFGVICVCGYRYFILPTVPYVDCEESSMAVADDKNNENIDNERNEITGTYYTQPGVQFWSGIQRALRIIRRIAKLTLMFSPIVAFYPVHWITWRILRNYNQNDDDDDDDDSKDAGNDDDTCTTGRGWWYYQLCLLCVECSGAACIKIMQWAGSRPDMFRQDFCAIFSKLQDSATPHSWKWTKAAMVDAYGEDWEDRIELRKDDILGCGCIAQVYKANAIIIDGGDGSSENGVENCSDSVDVNNENKQNNNTNNKNNRRRLMAVKVMHPNVEDDIDADLDILRLAVRVVEMLNIGPAKDLKWLNLPGFLEEMAVMLKTQLDLRTEGKNLIRFNKNFSSKKSYNNSNNDDEKNDDSKILFPQIISDYPPTKHVLMETYMDGIPVMQFIRSNKADQQLLTKMCTEAIEAVCQMIFLDNFTHGDLHPGNVLITKDCKFVLLDVGITTVHSEKDHRLISDILASFIRCDGRKAGRLMIDDSNSRMMNDSCGDRSIDEEKFCDEMEQFTIDARRTGLMEHLGTYITNICRSAATHHVMLNQSFISAALAIKIQEGVALALDPSIEIWKIAIPTILEGERRHGRAAERVKEIIGSQKYVSWLMSMTSGFTTQGSSDKEKENRI